MQDEAGYDLVVVANRLPVAVERTDDAVRWVRSPGGLVSSLEPALRSSRAVWVGWSGRATDVGEEGPEVPLSAGLCDLHEVPLTTEQVHLYYEGFSNATLWPLYHDAIAPPVYHREMWEAYVQVNRAFAREAAAVAAPGARVWVHDSQLQLVPVLLRELRPDLRIGFFLHIPFPPVELFLQLPWRQAILEGLLGADLVGFQTPGAVRNFVAVARRLLDVEPVEGGVRLRSNDGGHRHVSVAAFPISIDTREYDAMARSSEVQDAALDLRRRLGDPRWVLLGVDRLDYTKGIDVRLKAFTELLAEGRIAPGDAVFLQVATPTRENVEEYQRLRDEIALLVGRAMGDHGSVGAMPVQYLHQPFDRESVVAFYIAADVMLVTPYRDGMNLVCKEYVASRMHDDGALVLSEFAGAAVELTDSYLVNPYDADGVKRAILEAMHAPAEEKSRRMRAMRSWLFEHDVHRWATEYLAALDDAGQRA